MSHLIYTGPYESWQDATNASVGWDSIHVLRKVLNAIVDVLEGRKGYERDGTTFESLPEIYTLRNKLDRLLSPEDIVVDFGGGLGGTYINNRDLIEGRFKEFHVIEQRGYCLLGSILAKDYNLPITFLQDFSSLLNPNADIVILSGVLQHIGEWKSVVRSSLDLKPRHILIDRQLLVDDRTSIFVLEHEGYYDRKVSYPLWLLNQQEFLAAFEGYKVADSWISDFDPPEYKGFHLIPS